jgi:hypothetical protein
MGLEVDLEDLAGRGPSHDHVLKALVGRCGEQCRVEQVGDVDASLIGRVGVGHLVRASRQQRVDSVLELVHDELIFDFADDPRPPLMIAPELGKVGVTQASPSAHFRVSTQQSRCQAPGRPCRSAGGSALCSSGTMSLAPFRQVVGRARSRQCQRRR